MGVVAEHDGSRITYESRGALQIGGDRYGDDHGYRVDLQLLADSKSDGRHHQNRSNIVDKSRYCTGKEGHADGHPHYIGTLVEQYVRHQIRHFGRDEEVDKDHRSCDHHKDVPVDHSRKLRERKDPRNKEDQAGAQSVVGAIFWLRDHEHVHKNEKDQSK